MSKLIKLTGLNTFTAPFTESVVVRRDEVILVSDAQHDEVFNDGDVPRWTLVTGVEPKYDFSAYNPDAGGGGGEGGGGGTTTNPSVVAGQYRAAPVTLADGDAVPLLAGQYGQLLVQTTVFDPGLGVLVPADKATVAALGTPADAAAANPTATASLIAAFKGMWTSFLAMSAKLPASLGIKTAAQSLSTTPASDANVARENYATVTITSVTTAVVGTNYTAFAALACTALDIVNTSNADIQYQRGGAGAAMTIFAGTSRLVQGITNASQIGVRRVDTSNTQVTVPAEGFVV